MAIFFEGELFNRTLRNKVLRSDYSLLTNINKCLWQSTSVSMARKQTVGTLLGEFWARILVYYRSHSQTILKTLEREMKPAQIDFFILITDTEYLPGYLPWFLISAADKELDWSS